VRGLLISALGLVLAAPAAAADSGERPLFALVIGANRSPDAEVAPLRYADDDAVQNARLLRQMGAEVVLLVAPDAATRRLHPAVQASPPSRAAVAAGMRALDRRMAAARARGARPVFYFFYSGHGEVEHNRGYVSLGAERFYRDDLLQLLAAAPAWRKHVIVDACKSYFLVFERGPGGRRRPARGFALTGGEQELPADTGVLLSTSAAVDSHEWEAVGAGVFSHELRSALRGAADADGDGRVSYDEAAAFVWTANRAIDNPRFRPAVTSRPPAAAGRAGASVLLDLRGFGGDRLVVEAVEPGHRYVENGRGLRLVDFHPGRGQRLVLRLPGLRPLFVRRPGGGHEYALPDGSPIELAALEPRRSEVQRRGAEHLAFRRLFARPFGPAALVAWRSRPPQVERAAPHPDRWRWLRHGIGIGSAALAVGGGVLTGLALAERDGIDAASSGLERARANDRIEDYNTAAVVCYTAAGAAFITWLTWQLWPRDEPRIEVLPGTGGAGAGPALGWRF
jgi:hypothetical protein